MTVGRKFSTSTSAVATSLRSVARSPSCSKSSAIERFPQFVFTKYADVPPRPDPTLRRMSPTGGRSTFTTSAPCWARTIVANGPERFMVRSRMRTPARGPVPGSVIGAPYSARAARRATSTSVTWENGLRLRGDRTNIPRGSEIRSIAARG